MNVSSENSINARQRIQNKLGKTQIGKTNSAPFSRIKTFANKTPESSTNTTNQNDVKENTEFHDPFDG